MKSAPPNPPQFIYKIVPKELWRNALAEGIVPQMPIDVADGYMHFSTNEQLHETLALHFKGQDDLAVLEVPVVAVAQNLKWEPSRGGQLFPHLYAPLPKSAVAGVQDAQVDAQGKVTLTDAQ